jgi:adenine-specific DNA-methyltransferase
MTTLNGRTPDIAAENIEQLKEIFPEAFEEGKIDFDKLRQVLGEYVDDGSERYNFTWNGKGRALKLSQTPSMGTLRPCEAESKNWNDTQNLYIEGDNLEVLKLLQKSYHGKIKMIYIDPPYNTGSDFVYPDDFSDSIENYRKLTGQVDDEGRKISTNSEANGRYHTDWLNMMYPRLRLARNLLTDDGLIFISIDDNEIANLRRICDEIFGTENFVDNVIWKKRYGGGAKEKYLVSLHEYALMYCKNIEVLPEIFVPLSEESAKQYYTKFDEKASTRGGYRIHPLEAGKAMDSRPNLVYPIKAPDGSEIWPKRQWLWSKERAYTALSNNELEITKGNDNEWVVSSKQYLKDENGEIRPGKCFSIIEDIYTQHGTNEMISIMGNAKIFSYPKPSQFVLKLLQIASGKDSIVLDFFSGSATTAHAVMQLNAEDSGNRKFIMVQLPEPCAEDTEAAKAGYQNICEIGKERIRRAGEKIKAEVEEQNAQMKIGEEPKPVPDIGFKVFKLDSSNLRKWQPDYDNLNQGLEDIVKNYVDGRSELDVVYEIMLKMGLALTCPLDKRVIGGKNVYVIGMGALMICLDDNITTDVADGMAALYKELTPEVWKVVFKDNGFATDSAKVNVKEILKCAGLDEDAFTTV